MSIITTQVLCGLEERGSQKTTKRGRIKHEGQFLLVCNRVLRVVCVVCRVDWVATVDDYY